MPIHFDGHSKVHARAHPEATTNAQHKRAAVLTLSRHQEKRAAVGKNRKRGTGGLSASAGSDPLPFPVAHATSTSKMRDQRNDENTGKELCILHLVPFGSISITRAIKKKTRKTQRGAEEKTADQMWKRGERKQRRRKRRAALHPRTQAHRQTASSTTTSESQELHFASYLMCIVRFRLSLPFHHAVLRCAPRSFAAQGGGFFKTAQGPAGKRRANERSRTDASRAKEESRKRNDSRHTHK